MIYDRAQEERVAAEMFPDLEQHIARGVRAWRDRRNLTAEKLSKEVAKHGGKLSRQAISKIENDDRSVSLVELMVLARALSIAPLQLIFPVGRVAEVAGMDGANVPAWEVAKWFTGESYYPTRTPDGRWSATREDREAWEMGAAALAYFRDHDRLQRALLDARAERSEDPAAFAALRLMDLRRNMRRAGTVPPDLPAELHDLEPTGGSTDGDQEG